MSDLPVAPLVFPFGLGESSTQAGIEVLGGKGASLAEMTRAGFPVPPGFTISTACCVFVEQHDGQWPLGLEAQVRQAVERLEAVTSRQFGRMPRPLLVAVRSGAPVSMPGMMDTILNCGLNPSLRSAFPSEATFWKEYADHIRQFAASIAGITLLTELGVSNEQRAGEFLAQYEQRTGRQFPTNPWDILQQAINAVFASWHSPRAKAYRQHHDVSGNIGTAVNVQAMFASERSGVLFTVDPNDPNSGEMILEASWGLGEAVVSGAVTPDIYAIDVATLQTKREMPGTRPGHEPALNDDQRREIAALGRRIETHFGVSSDIEWGICEGRVALLQTRKIRGLDVVEETERGRLEEIARLKRLATEPMVWVIHNLSETLPAPTPMTWDLMRWFMSARGGYGQMYRLLGHRPQEQHVGEGFLELIAGRIYVDPRRAAEFHFGKMPFEYDIDEILRDRTALDRRPTRFNVDRTDSLFFFRLPSLLIDMIRGARQMKQMSLAADTRFQEVALPRLEQYLAEVAQIDLDSLSTGELVRELFRRRDFVLGEFAAESLIPGFFGGVAHDQLRQLLVQLLGPVEGEQTLNQLTTGLEGDVTVEQNLLLADVASGQVDRREFVTRYGHRAVNEMELSQPRWNEHESFVDQMIAQFQSLQVSPLDRHVRQQELRQQAEQTLASKLAQAGGSSFLERIEKAMTQAQRLLPYRETGKFHLMRGYTTLRDVLVTLGERWNLASRDVFFLQLPELELFEQDRATIESRLATRKLRWRAYQKLLLSDVLDSRRLDELGRPQPVVTSDSQQIVCRPIAGGASRGTARIVCDPADIEDLGRDYILVCPSTDPGWTPLFVNARGLIVERGGVLSHGAIVARDFGIPAVVLEGATRLVPEGSTLELDANRGTISILQGTPIEAGAS